MQLLPICIGLFGAFALIAIAMLRCFCAPASQEDEEASWRTIEHYHGLRHTHKTPATNDRKRQLRREKGYHREHPESKSFLHDSRNSPLTVDFLVPESRTTTDPWRIT
ncbi:hypothetical protein BJ166DRAFT_620004 [Pestalotiopsis sp. NC0098]|nr:hypothetical protein BJ166DRAFT_620004 [Pestalotiopsis sp. NC0098]